MSSFFPLNVRPFHILLNGTMVFITKLTFLFFCKTVEAFPTKNSNAGLYNVQYPVYYSAIERRGAQWPGCIATTQEISVASLSSALKDILIVHIKSHPTGTSFSDGGHCRTVSLKDSGRLCQESLGKTWHYVILSVWKQKKKKRTGAK